MFTFASLLNDLPWPTKGHRNRCTLRVQSGMDFSDLNGHQAYHRPEDTKVEMCQVIEAGHVNKSTFLSSGQLLKWVDITACLAAEKLAGRQCVTVSVDDLYFEDQVQLGDVICLKGQVNRAFNTSMEVGVQVSKEQAGSPDKTICEAFLTFVAINSNGNKVKLPPFICDSHSSEVCYSLAEERRRVRISHSKTINHLLQNYSLSSTESVMLDFPDRPVVAASKTRVESIELVLPPHANHHGNTFGGQIMAWMVNVGFISASRFTRDEVVLRSVDMVHFRGPSHVADRIVLLAIVNYASQHSLEVGVRVEAYNCDDGEIGGRRHINSAFLTYESEAELPMLHADYGEEGSRRYSEATARFKLRLDRRYILSSKRLEKLSVVYSDTNIMYLSLDNVTMLSQLASKQDWKEVASKDRLTLSTREGDGILQFKVSKKFSNSKVTEYHAFKILSDPIHRAEWDPLMSDCKLIHGVPGVDDCVYHSVMRPFEKGMRPNDFVLLCSCREPSREGDPYIVALRSVIVEDIENLIETGHNRLEVACAGFIIQQLPGENTEVSYYNETNPQIVKYVTSDVAGFSKLYCDVYKRMENYVVDKL